MNSTTSAAAPKALVNATVFPILFTISFAHLLNDMMQSVIPSIYPLIKSNLQLSFSQIGLITFTFQITASLLQPFVGQYTDKSPKPYSLAIGMGFSLLGLAVLSMATGFYGILLAVGLVGVGSSIFHPEASRVAHLASGGKRGLAQSIFQLGVMQAAPLVPPAGSRYYYSAWTIQCNMVWHRCHPGHLYTV
ncbi:MFS transporter [Paraflavitalea speifideaquila]|uniref:MFS transporter n=1 Tax=Paraflavitalea speifideaquila TaxID=3076558 RepID=UPI0028EBC58E|nr:MFS transporter [Paraflavitalea speifideiaquila]